MTAPRTALVRTGGTPVLPSFGGITYSLVQQFLANAQKAYVAVSRAFVDGEHWQKGKGWVGPHPPRSAEGYGDVMQAIQEAFTSWNVIEEILERHTSGVVGDPPIWSFTVKRTIPEGQDITPAEQALINDVVGPLGNWWTRRKIGKKLQQWVRTLLVAERAMLRLYIPEGLLIEETDANGIKTGALRATARTLEEALNLIYLDTPSTEDSTMYTDPRTQRQLGITALDTEVNGQWTGLKAYELTYLSVDGSNRTVIRRIDQKGDASYEMDLGGRLTMSEAERPRLITEQIIQGQRALNLALSMLPRTVVTGGFLERVILNGQMPGEWIVNDKGERIGFKPAAFRTGAGSTNWISGQTVEERATDGTITTKLVTPDVKWRPPADTKPIADALDKHYEVMLREAKQAHVLMNGESGNSGISYAQARADFGRSLTTTQESVEPEVSWLLETAVAWAEAISGQLGRYTIPLRATVQCAVNTGPLSVAERTQNVAEVAANLLSPETAIQRNGTRDVDGEMNRIQEQTGEKIQRLKLQADVVNVLTTAGFPLELAAEVVGMEPSVVGKVKRFATEQRNNPPPEPIPPTLVAG